nr:asparaginase [Deinococcus hopiensis]
MPSDEAHVLFRRGGLAESVHRIHAAVVNASGQLIASCGDPDLVTFPRPSSKPFQALPLALASPDLPGDELAAACTGHAGTPEQQAVAAAGPLGQRLDRFAMRRTPALRLRDGGGAASAGRGAHAAAPQLLGQTCGNAAGLRPERLATRGIPGACPPPANPHPRTPR